MQGFVSWTTTIPEPIVVARPILQKRRRSRGWKWTSKTTTVPHPWVRRTHSLGTIGPREQNLNSEVHEQPCKSHEAYKPYNKLFSRTAPEPRRWHRRR